MLILITTAQPHILLSTYYASRDPSFYVAIDKPHTIPSFNVAIHKPHTRLLKSYEITEWSGLTILEECVNLTIKL